MSTFASGSRNQNIGGTGSPIREISASTSTPARPSATWVASRDPRGAARQVHLDPPVAVAQRGVDALLEAEPVDVPGMSGSSVGWEGYRQRLHIVAELIAPGGLGFAGDSARIGGGR
jgi:hypothetical protein